ncbi:metallophosphoesterase [uncultured Halomonas sp.]|mgnify:CR=1 FL=1|uniref:metallophosphoesterase family protein n=1 Tax=uncultured Halomonas sp. TaxID=173971 RepID=UPI002639D128|nr:metallophosphoesterase [uncultured Halomonas sp.]
MRILFYSDPHFGLARRENVTESSLRAREAYCVGYLNQLTQGYDLVVCLGDLFDRAHNKEEVILRAAKAVEHTDYILAGNHDLINREGAISSLNLLKEICPSKVVLDPMTVTSGVHLHFVPHHRTQAEFDQALDVAFSQVNGGKHFLLLHCNFDSPYADKEQDLNLTGAQAERLLTRFDTILIGHEHAGRDLLGGRVKIVGSLFPTSFGDAEAKHRALVYDTELQSFSEIVTQCNVYEGPASQYTGDPARGYLKLFDDMPSGGTSKLAVSLFESGAFAVKIISSKNVPRGTSTEAVASKPVSLPELVGQMLREQDPKLMDLWYEFLAQQRGVV